MSDETKTYYGKDCPEGMVQVEFVGCSPKDRVGDYGWKPTKQAFIEVYIDGRRFRIDVGTDYRGKRGLHITAEEEIEIAQDACNALSVSHRERK